VIRRRHLQAVPGTGGPAGGFVPSAIRVVVTDDDVPRVHAIRPVVGPGHAEVVIRVGNQAIAVFGEAGLLALRQAFDRAGELAEWAFQAP
jgi:hypothetical protein